jgi:hypothetical protein
MIMRRRENMSSNRRFVLNEGRCILDTLNPSNDAHYCLDQDEPEDEKYLRERVLMRRLHVPINKLIVNRRPLEKLPSGEYYQPSGPSEDGIDEIYWPILNAICASNLNTFDPGMSIQHKSTGKLNRQKIGTRDFTSLSLFCDDVELLLRDLYGDVDSEAMDRILLAVLAIVEGFTKYVRRDLWQEFCDAESFDYMFGIGLPDGYKVINGSMWRCGLAAKSDLILRVCEVRANPSAFSEYTVEFAKRFGQNWVCSPETAAEVRGA